MVSRYLLLFTLIVVLAFGFLAILVYWDCKQSGIESPKKWAAFVFITGFLGLILYITEKDTYMEDPNDADPYVLPGGTNKDRRESDQE